MCAWRGVRKGGGCSKAGGAGGYGGGGGCGCEEQNSDPLHKQQ